MNLIANQIKSWVDIRREFYCRSMKSWLQDTNIKMCLILNQGKYVIGERSIRTLKRKIYKYVINIKKGISNYLIYWINITKNIIIQLMRNLLIKIIIKNFLNLKLITMLEYQNIKIFLLNSLFQIDVKTFFWLKLLLTLCHGLFL